MLNSEKDKNTEQQKTEKVRIMEEEKKKKEKCVSFYITSRGTKRSFLEHLPPCVLYLRGSRDPC